MGSLKNFLQVGNFSIQVSSILFAQRRRSTGTVILTMLSGESYPFEVANGGTQLWQDLQSTILARLKTDLTMINPAHIACLYRHPTIQTVTVNLNSGGNLRFEADNGGGKIWADFQSLENGDRMTDALGCVLTL